MSNSGMNYQGFKNARFDALMAEAQRERDPQRRIEQMQEAEKLLLEDFGFAPYRYSLTPDLVQPYVKGWIKNGKNINATRWLSVERPAS
jgi:ABC-type oligopeptide transport system substrate-binding subunit